MIALKIGRKTYEITDEDKFMDNGSCVQLTTQSRIVDRWGSRPNPVLSERAIKEIAGFKKQFHDHQYSKSVYIFSLSDV